MRVFYVSIYIYMHVIIYMLCIIMCIRSIIILYANYGRPPPPPYNNNNKNNNTPRLANRSPRRPLFAVPRTRVDDVFRIPDVGLFFPFYIFIYYFVPYIYNIIRARIFIYIIYQCAKYRLRHVRNARL